MFDFSKFDKEFAVAIRIGDVFHEIARNIPNLFVQDRRKDGPNPYHDRTSQGLVLEFYYGTPGKVWTPWGYYEYCGSSGGSSQEFDRLTSEFFVQVKTRLHKPAHSNSNGVYGPYHVVLGVDGIELPEPEKLSGFEDGFYTASKTDWEMRLRAMKEKPIKFVVKNKRLPLYSKDRKIMARTGSVISTTEDISEAERFDSVDDARKFRSTLNEFWIDANIVPVQ